MNLKDRRSEVVNETKSALANRLENAELRSAAVNIGQQSQDACVTLTLE
jgi:hypothetical protein